MQGLYCRAGLVLFFLAHAGGALAAPTQFGSGASLGGATASDTANEDRLNVDRVVAYNLYPGTYNVLDFSLNVLNPNNGSGTLTPMIVTGTPGNYTTLWVGSAFDPSVSGVQTPATYAPGSQTFTVTGGVRRVYAGFFTGSAGSEIPAINTSVGITDHDNSFVAPSGVGQNVSGFSNPNLVRSYAFGVNADIPSAAFAPVYTNTNGSVAAVSNDLLQTKLASVTATGVGGNIGGLDLAASSGESLLRNGTATTTAGYTTGSTTATGVVNGATITYNFDTVANLAGYQIDAINLFAGWRDGGRDRIGDIDVAYSTVANPGSFIDIITDAVSGDYASFFGQASIIPAGSNTFLATGVASLRLTFNGIENGAGGISEIDVLGSAVTPEPATIVIWSMIGLGLVAVGYRRVRARI